MTTTALPYFKLQTQQLWNHPDGPRREATDDTLLKECHQSLQNKFHQQTVGFFDWPENIPKKEMESLTQLARRLREDFDRALIFGIGGSHLGPEALVQALQPPETADAFPLFWLNNVDPWSIRQAEVFLSQGKCAAVVVSKSGGTTETLSGYFHFASRLSSAGTVFITDPESGFLRELAEKKELASLPIPPNIGGRFSVLTSVGLFPMALSGLEVEGVLEGARKMREFLKGCSPETNPAYDLALAYQRWDMQGAHTQYLMPYWKSLRLVADWFVQLWGESLGKKRTADGAGVGFTPGAALGTMDQHSLLQLFKEGPRNKLVGFMTVPPSHPSTPVGEPGFDCGPYDFLARTSFDRISHEACLATEQSLVNSGVPTYRVELETIQGPTLGALLFFWETACAFAGELYGVDAFNQPGVEESKVLLKKALHP